VLTSNLLNARVYRGVVQPYYVDPTDRVARRMAEELIAVFGMFNGRPRSELDEALQAAVGAGRSARFGRGLVKLLEDRCTFEVVSPMDPVEIRRRLFVAAADHFPVTPTGRFRTTPRTEILRQVAEQLEITPDQVDQAMFADLPSARVLRCDALPSAGWLLDRYNVALAQAVLLRATDVQIRLQGGSPGSIRRFFQYIKFFRLMFRVRSQPNGGYLVEIDGPLSLFRLSTKYGLQLAEMLPALLLCDNWSLEASLLWGRRREKRRFVLDSSEGLKSHYSRRGTYELREITWLRDRLAKLETPWCIEPTPAILDLGGQDLCIPDAVLRHPDGRTAYLEVAGFWRRQRLEKRLALLRAHGPPNLILAVSKNLRASAEERISGEVACTFFRDMINAREVVKLAEAIATAPVASTGRTAASSGKDRKV